MHPSDSLHPAAHFVPPNVHESLLLLFDEVPVPVPELQAPANTPVATRVSAAASHRVIEWFNMTISPEESEIS
jgi:hypothetical protein